jgi:SAM-dependent methyltransferase
MSSVSFDRYAARYDDLRPVDDNWWELFDELVRLGELRGRRVLDVGGGTGRLAEALEQRAQARAWAVDASPAMVERAKSLGVNARVARAEALPFKAGWFDAVVLRMVVHLVDRPRVFAEAARVLGPAGTLLIATEDADHFDEVWFAQFFPSVPELERSRFPGERALRAELSAAGFDELRFERLTQSRSLTREHALDILRSRAYSTFELLPPDEYEAGVRRAEAELPERIAYDYHWLIPVATFVREVR